MTRFTFVRHGQSEGNLHELFIGQTNLPLTTLGRMQAAKSRDHLKNEHFDLAIASPLLRAYETGSIVLGDRPLPLLPNDNIREIWGGEWEMKKFADLPLLYPDDFSIWHEDIGRARCTGGESVKELGERVVGEVLRIAREHPGKSILAASHATPIRTLMTYASGIPLEEAQNVPWPANASVSVFTVDEEGTLRVECYGEASHLGNLSTTLPKNI